jgi:hypothetical protein
VPFVKESHIFCSNGAKPVPMTLDDKHGDRKYLTAGERDDFREAAESLRIPALPRRAEQAILDRGAVCDVRECSVPLQGQSLTLARLAPFRAPVDLLQQAHEFGAFEPLRRLELSF